MLMVRIIAEMVARNASLDMRPASRNMEKKMVAIEPKMVPTTPDRKLASGRTSAGLRNAGFHHEYAA